MIAARQVARAAALISVAIDLAGAWSDWQPTGPHMPLRIAAAATALALVPCAIAFLLAIAARVRLPGRHMRHAIDTMRLPLIVPRAYVGAAVLGGIGALAAMGEGFGLYIFLAGIALIALALSQARPRNA